MSNNKYCPDCGKLQEEEDIFCMDCGTKIGSSTSASNSKSSNSQQSNESIEYGKSTQMETTYIEQTNSNRNEEQNYVGIVSIIISCLGLGLFLIDNSITEGFAFGFGIIGVIIGISLFQKHKKPMGFIGIVLGAVSIAVWITL